MVKALPVYFGSRKEARVRLKVTPGSGEVYVNGTPIDYYGHEVAREKILMPLRLDERFWKAHSFYLRARGGGVMGTADACASAIARAMAAHSAALKAKILSFNRYLLAGDPRRTEPKKPNRRSARRFKQKSYR